MAVPAEAIMNVDEQNKIFAKAFKRIKLCTNGIMAKSGSGGKRSTCEE